MTQQYPIGTQENPGKMPRKRNGSGNSANSVTMAMMSFVVSTIYASSLMLKPMANSITTVAVFLCLWCAAVIGTSIARRY